jgi:hypothetical protein
LVYDLIAADLVDGYRLFVHPVVLRARAADLRRRHLPRSRGSGC